MLLVPLPPLVIDEYTPSLPHMVHSLNGTQALMQLSVSVYLFCMAFGQWIAGPISDRTGRRKPLFITLAVFLVGTLICAFSSAPETFLFGRAIQGLGMGCCAMTAPAIIGDSFSDNEIKKVSSLLIFVYSFVPIIAPIIGGYIQEYIGWRANFIFLFAFTAVIYAITLIYLPETHTPQDHHRLEIRLLLRNYTKVSSNRYYMSYVLSLCFLWSTLISFGIFGPFLIQVELGHSPSSYGNLALFLGIAFMLGNFVNKPLLILGQKKIVGIGLGVSVISGVSMLIIAYMKVFDTWTVMTPIFFIIFGSGLAFPNLYGCALSVFKDLVGIASSLIGCLMLIGTAAITSIMTMMSIQSPFQISAFYLVLIGMGSLLYYIGNKVVSTDVKLTHPTS